MAKGSILNALKNEADMKRLVLEFTEKLENDPYQPGLVHPEIYPDDVQEVLEDLLWLRGFTEATIKVKKNPDGVSVSVEVLGRTKG